MGAIPEQSFTVRVPAWWDDKAEYVLADYPGRDEAMRLAGHDWDVIELRSFTEYPNEVIEAATKADHLSVNPEGKGRFVPDKEYVSHLRSDNLFLLAKSSDSFERIQNSVAYDLAELLIEDGFLFETGGTMYGGKLNYLTLLLNEPITITGDTSTTLPYVGASWAHDGSASLSIRSTSVRQVCENTVSASEAEGQRLGTNFVFRHTKNVGERIAEAKKVIGGVRELTEVYVEAMEELATIEVTPAQRDLYVSRIIGDARPTELDGEGRQLYSFASKDVSTSDRVKSNIEAERAKINSLFFGVTIPEAHKLTGYGLHLAGVEYFDHLRATRSKDAYVKRTLLTDNPAKANLRRTIEEVLTAA